MHFKVIETADIQLKNWFDEEIVDQEVEDSNEEVVVEEVEADEVGV